MDKQDRNTESVIPSPCLALVRGSVPRSMARQNARNILRREGHQLAVVATGDGYAQDPWFHWLADLRRGRQQIFGGLLRFIDACVRRKVPKWVVDRIAPLVQGYADEAYRGGGHDPDKDKAVKVA